MQHRNSGFGHAAFAEAVEQFGEAVFKQVDLAVERFHIAGGIGGKRLLQGCAEFGQELFGTDAGFDHFFQLGGGDAH